MNPTSSVARRIKPIVGTLRVSGGTRLKDATPYTVALSPPSRAASGREDEHLFILLELTGPLPSRLYRELREVVAQTYWSTGGSITAALRRAAASANRHLFQANLHSAPADRYEGGLSCAVLHGDDMFVLRSGPGWTCFLHGESLECFSCDEELVPLGVKRVANTRLHHTFVAPGDRLVLASSALTSVVGEAGLARVLPRPKVQDVLEGLEQIGGGVDFTALVVHCAPVEEEAAARDVLRSISHLARPISASASQEDVTDERRAPRLLSRLKTPLRPRPVTISVEPPGPSPAEPEVEREPEPEPHQEEPEEHGIPETLAPETYEDEEPAGEREPPRRVIISRPHPEPAREPGPGLGEQVGRGLRTVGRGVAAAGMGLAGAASTLFRRMLPGAEQERRSRARAARPHPARPAPPENRAAMMAIAIGIPILVVVLVMVAYLSFGTHSRVQGLIEQAEEEIVLAQAAGIAPEDARPHWEAALEHANAALALRPDDPVATALRLQAQTALDRLDGIVRLDPIQLWDFGPVPVPRKLVVHGQMIFVLDPTLEQVVQLTLNQTADGVVEQGEAPILVQKGQQIGGDKVGGLVDFVWVGLGSERLTSGLVVLEEDGALVTYDPAWEGEAGSPRLMRSFLGTPPHAPQAVDSFEGRFYVLDVGINQIRRYKPRGDTYPEPPDNYFVDPAALPASLENARDMAIDGYIYVLYNDGGIYKFLQGELDESFSVRGVPGQLDQAIALSVDPHGGSGRIYVADQGNNRVVVLGSAGEFQAQFRAGEAFEMLETLAVDEASARLYVIGNGRLYVAPLP